MNQYAQNGEDTFVLRYFNTIGVSSGNLLEIGANDGLTLSNSRLLIEQGWKATLLEPGGVFSQLNDLCKDKPDVTCLNFGISDKEETVRFYESGAHVKGGEDVGLVSTTDAGEMERWRKAGVKFTTVTAQMNTFDWFKGQKFDFISIDAEGMDWKILQQIDLRAVGCKMICIEWNSQPLLDKLYRAYCHSFGLKEFTRNAENIIYGL